MKYCTTEMIQEGLPICPVRWLERWGGGEVDVTILVEEEV